MEESFDKVPLQSIEFFEKITRLRVTINDIAGNLRPFLPDIYFTHDRSELCRQIKKEHTDLRCNALDLHWIKKNIYNYRSGMVKLCHAGLIEIVQPLYIADGLQAIFFAGQFVADAETHIDGIAVDANRTNTHPWKCDTDRSMLSRSPLNISELLEAMHQLVCRLEPWCRALTGEDNAGDGIGHDGRKIAIIQYISRHYAEPVTVGRVSEYLSLSRYRTAHLIKELFGVSCVALVNSFRIKHACNMLQYSQQSVSEIALSNGFNDLSYFIATFRKATGMTPREYRKKNRI